MATIAELPTVTSIKAVSQGRRENHRVDPRIIQIEKGFNIRKTFDREKLNELKTLIRENGYLDDKPIVVSIKDGVMYVRDGERRLRAIRELIKEGVEIDTVPVSLSKRQGADEIIGMFIWNGGEKLNMLEEGYGILELEEKFEMSRKEIAEKIGKTEATVSNCLKLAKAPESLRNRVHKGEISCSQLLDVLRQTGGDEEKANNAIEKALEKAGKENEGNGNSGKATGKTLNEKVGLSKEVQETIATHLETCDISDEEKGIAKRLLKLKVVAE